MDSRFINKSGHVCPRLLDAHHRARDQSELADDASEEESEIPELEIIDQSQVPELIVESVTDCANLGLV